MCDTGVYEKEEKNIEEDLIKYNLSTRDFAFYKNLSVDWTRTYTDGRYLGYALNQLDDLVVALYHNNVIYLLGKTYPTIMYAPKIIFHVSGENLHIDDILSKDNNVGNGSIAMRALLKYAKQNELRSITGTLSTIDDDHKERRNHFYEKFGFKVTPKSIFKDLSKEKGE